VGRVTPFKVQRAAVDITNRERPDLVMLTGDFVCHSQLFLDQLREVVSGYGVPTFAVLGNHDNDHDMPPALTAKGFVVLRDARTRLTIRGETLDLAGVRFWTRKPSEIAYVLRGAAPNLILLAHTPMRLIEASSLAVPLVLSGHTHGGQIVLPGIGAVAAREFPVIAGAGRRENTRIFVSRGVGTVYVPVRLNCPPEVAVLTLRPVEG